MFVMTMTKRKLLRAIMFLLVLITGIAIGVFAILSSIGVNAAGLKLPIYNVERNDNKISLTFDCAWGNSNTDNLIAILAEEKVSATFFVTGEFCDKYPEDIKKLHDAGHEIANHSDKHPHVKGMNVNDLIEDTKECSRKIEMLTGEKTALYRAPYGEYDDNVITTLTGMGLSVIQWNADSIDWDKPDVQTIINRTTRNISSGSILLFHNDLENTEKALPDILKSLKEQGFEFCKTSELIYTEDYTIDPQGKQIKNSKSTSAIVYSENWAVNSAFQALEQNMSVQDVEQLATGGMTPQIAMKNSEFLTSDQIAALQTLSYEELKELFAKLKTAVYNREANVPESTTASETSAPSSTTGKDEGFNDEPIIAETTGAETSAAPQTTIPDKEDIILPSTTASETSAPGKDEPIIAETTGAETSAAPQTTVSQ